MGDIPLAASLLYDLLDQRSVDAPSHERVLRWMASEMPSFDEELLLSQDREWLASTLVNQPTSSALRRKWRPSFRGDDVPGVQQCREFLNEVISSIEDISGAQVGPIEAGTTCSRKGTPGDVHTRRLNSNFGWSVQITTEGSGTFNCVRQTLQSRPGDLFLFSPDGLFDYGRAETCDTWIHHWVFFQPEARWLDLLRWPEVGPGIFCLHAGQEQDYQILLSLFMQVHESRHCSDTFSDQLTRNLLEQLLIRCQVIIPESQRQGMDSRIEKAVNTIRKNYQKPLSVDDVAGEVGLSSSRLATLFKQQTGMSVVAYRDEIRMSKACQLLASSRLPVIQVAQEVGYFDPQYFSRCFRQKIGVTPLRYRKRETG